jgi:hypothetical protein
LGSFRCAYLEHADDVFVAQLLHERNLPEALPVDLAPLNHLQHHLTRHTARNVSNVLCRGGREGGKSERGNLLAGQPVDGDLDLAVEPLGDGVLHLVVADVDGLVEVGAAAAAAVIVGMPRTIGIAPDVAHAAAAAAAAVPQHATDLAAVERLAGLVELVHLKVHVEGRPVLPTPHTRTQQQPP